MVVHTKAMSFCFWKGDATSPEEEAYEFESSFWIVMHDTKTPQGGMVGPLGRRWGSSVDKVCGEPCSRTWLSRDPEGKRLVWLGMKAMD